VRSQRRHSGKVVLIEDSDEVRLALESIEAPESDDPLRRCDGAELKRLVHAVLDRLPGRYGEALEWKYVEGRSVEEIGDLLGIGHTAAQSLLARARVAFRDGLEAVFGASAADVLASLETGRGNGTCTMKRRRLDRTTAISPACLRPPACANSHRTGRRPRSVRRSRRNGVGP